MVHPYVGLPPECFWRTGVAQNGSTSIESIYQKRFTIEPEDQIVTAGSCFAQHITRELKSHSFQLLDLEPPPIELPCNLHQLYGYSLYSARYGNIYTAKQLLQLAKEAFSLRPMRVMSWKRGDQILDALRPTIEPDGYSCVSEMVAHREHHLACVRECFERMDVFVFTLGLTEAWCDLASGSILPVAPGVIAGVYDPAKTRFVNFSFLQILRQFERFLKILQKFRSDRELPKILLTVSPVPLTATASGRHVLLATTDSKAVLRAVASELQRRHENIDYFPSFEIINHPAKKNQFFDENLRTVSDIGVQSVMECFLQNHQPPLVGTIEKQAHMKDAQQEEVFQSLICEEELMERDLDD